MSWPRLLGRILFIFFGGSKPAIRDLRLEASFSELTADIQESWASCFWARSRLAREEDLNMLSAVIDAMG